MLRYSVQLLIVFLLVIAGTSVAEVQAADALPANESPASTPLPTLEPTPVPAPAPTSTSTSALVTAPIKPGHILELQTTIGTTFNAYVTGAEDAKRGVLIIHDRRGLGDYAKSWAERFAAIGYRALVVDLYDGRYSTDPTGATRIMTSIDQESANANLKAALSYLKAPERTLATFGWDFGGAQALRAALQDPDAVAATVIYYGPMITDLKALRTLKGPVLGIFAKNDPWVSPLHVAGYQDAMREAGVPFSAINYNAGHGFTNPINRVYNKQLADDAWQKTQVFLEERLTVVP